MDSPPSRGIGSAYRLPASLNKNPAPLKCAIVCPPRPPGPASGSYRVFRGGGWNNDGQDCRSAYRYGYGLDYRYDYLGFRAALVPSE